MSNPSTYMHLLCPQCDRNGHMRVVDSRAVKQLNAIRRRRRCDACGHRFTTYETLERSRDRVVQTALDDAAKKLEQFAAVLKRRSA